MAKCPEVRAALRHTWMSMYFPEGAIWSSMLAIQKEPAETMPRVTHVEMENRNTITALQNLAQVVGVHSMTASFELMMG